MKKVSIIVPIYNAEKWLHECLTSICEQTYLNLEIILINDGSTDLSMEICNKFAEKDDRIILIEHENRGVSYTRNCGINIATGHYIMFLDADDYVLTDMIQQYVTIAEKYDAEIVIGGIEFIDEFKNTKKIISIGTGVYTQKDFLALVCREKTGVFGYVPNKLYKRDIIKGNKIYFREDMSVQEDLEFALSVYAHISKVATSCYCGYKYYCVEGKRLIQAKDLLHNQLKLLSISNDVGVEDDDKKEILEKISNMTYVTLFHIRDVSKIREVAQIPGLVDCLWEVNVDSLEKRTIIKLFLRKKYRTVLHYFLIRRAIKKMLGKGE